MDPSTWDNHCSPRGGLAHPALLDALRSGRTPRPPAAVLELGCGEGIGSCTLANEGYSVTAVDADPVAIARAKSLTSHSPVPVAFLAMNALDIGRFRAESFAMTVAVDFLHMISLEERTRLAELVGQLLIPGGVFLIIDRVPLTTLLPRISGFQVEGGDSSRSYFLVKTIG